MSLFTLPLLLTSPDLLSAWQSYMRARNLAERTWRDQPEIISRIAADTNTPAAEFTTEQLIVWLDEIGVSPGSKATYFTAVRAWSRWLVRAGYRHGNPTDHIDPPRVGRALPKPITTSQLRNLLSTDIEPRTAAKILLGAYAGLRVHEIAHIPGSDFDLAGNALYVRGKGGVTAPVPLHPCIAELATQYETRSWWFPSPTRRGHVRGDSVSTILGDAMKRSGIYGGHPHQLRHWLATELTRQGVNARVIQVIMCHASLATTARYALVEDTSRQRAISLLPEPPTKTG